MNGNHTRPSATPAYQEYRTMRHRRIAAVAMLASSSMAITAAAVAVCLALAPKPRPVDRSVAYCLARPGLAEMAHPCRNENVLVNL